MRGGILLAKPQYRAVSVSEMALEVEPRGEILAAVLAYRHAVVSMLSKGRRGADWINLNVVLLLHVLLESRQIRKGFFTPPTPKLSQHMSATAPNEVAFSGSLKGPRKGCKRCFRNFRASRGRVSAELLQFGEHHGEGRETGLYEGGRDLRVLGVHTLLMQAIQASLQDLEGDGSVVAHEA